MDPSQNNNQDTPAGWNPFMYAMQCPPGTWFPQGFQQQVPNAPMTAGTPNVPLMQPTGMGTMFPRPGFFPANVATPVPDEAEVEVANPTDDVMSPSNNSSGPKKLPNFSPNEDCCLVKLWLEISCDPVVGNGQKLDRMWSRIKERYDSRAYQPRSVRSLQSRWSIIKKEVGKFAGFYADAVKENPSGMSDANKTSMAAANFVAVTKQKFQFMHCWDIMKDEPKWCDAPDPSDLIDQGVGDDIGQDDNRVQVEGEKSTGKRPMGRDRAKAAAKKSKGSAGSTSSEDYASKMQDLSIQKISILQEENQSKREHFQMMATIEEKRYQEMRSHNESVIQIEREKMTLMRQQHDERILAVDLESCTPALRIFYQAMQEEILDNITSRWQNRPPQ